VTISNTSIDIALSGSITKDTSIELYVEDVFDNPNTSSSNKFIVKTEYTCSESTISITDDSDNSITEAD